MIINDAIRDFGKLGVVTTSLVWINTLLILRSTFSIFISGTNKTMLDITPFIGVILLRVTLGYIYIVDSWANGK